jgi:hypothetical protein
VSIGAALHTFLSGGLSVGDRIYPVHLPEGVELPAIVYRGISANNAVTHSDDQDHPTYTGTRHVISRFQFDCMAETYDDAEELADELLTFAVGFRGTVADVDIDGVTPDLRLDDWDEEVAIYRVIQDLMIGHRAVPSS